MSNIVELFLSKRTQRWNGKWYVADLKPPVAAPVSTYGTAPVSVAFTMSIDGKREWFGSHDAYEVGWSRVGYTNPSTECGDCDDSDTGLYIWAAVIIGSLFVVAIWMGYMRMRQRRRHEELALEEAERAQVQQDQFNRMYAVMQESVMRNAQPDPRSSHLHGYAPRVSQPHGYGPRGYDAQQYDYQRGY